jgi:hypothetical protein
MPTVQLCLREDSDKKHKDSTVCELRKYLSNPERHKLTVFEQHIVATVRCDWLVSRVDIGNLAAQCYLPGDTLYLL